MVLWIVLEIEHLSRTTVWQEEISYNIWNLFLLVVTMLLTEGYSQLPFHAATQTRGEPTYPGSHHPQSE